MGKIDLAKLVLWAYAEIKGEVTDDGKYSAGEVVEFLGLLCRKLEAEPDLAGYAGVLHWVGGGLLHIAQKMGETEP